MIVVIVAEQHNIDARKIFPPHSGRAAAARANRSKGTGALRPDWIRQNVGTDVLDEQRGMVDETHSQLIATDASRRFGYCDVRNELRGNLGSGGQLPSQQMKKARRPSAIRIEEALAVKMSWKCRCAGEIVHESLFTHRSVRPGER